MTAIPVVECPWRGGEAHVLRLGLRDDRDYHVALDPVDRQRESQPVGVAMFIGGGFVVFLLIIILLIILL